MRAGLHRRAAAGRREPGTGVPTRRRADPGRGTAQDQADPTALASRPRGRAPAGGTGDRRVEEPGARSAAGGGGRASAPRPRTPRSSAPRSSAPRSSGRRSWPPGSWVPGSWVPGSWVPRPRVPGSWVPRPRVRRCRARPSEGSRRPGSPEAEGSVPASAHVSGRAGAGGPRVAAAAGRTRRRRRPARSGPRRRSAGRRGVRPGVFACGGRSHRGPGRCRHVPPGTPPGPCCPAAPQDTPYLTSVGREKSPVGPRRPIVTNCTYSRGIDPVTPSIEKRRVTQPEGDRN
jgi:hypothetical protein